MRLILIVAAIMLSVGLAAQDFNARVGAGVVASQVDGDRYAGYHKFGFSAGASVDRMLSRNMGFRLGLRYARKGSHTTDDNLPDFYHTELHYAELPVSAFYAFRNCEFEAGLACGYLLKAKEDVDGYGLTGPAFKFRRAELGVLTGVNYQIIKNVYITMQFNYSLTAIRKYSKLQDAHITSGLHNNWEIGRAHV